jgi:glutamine amidotransferase PdxT
MIFLAERAEGKCEVHTVNRRRHACCRTQPVWGTCAGMIFLAERAEGKCEFTL